MVMTEGELLLRNDAARPLMLPANDPALALEMLLGADTDLAGINLVVHASAEDWQLYGGAVEALRGRVATLKVQLGSGGLLAQFSQGLAHSQPINLLQGSFRPQRSAGAGWQQWRWAAMLAGALLLLHGGGSWWQLHQLRQASAASRQEISRLYASVFPGQPAGAQPRRLMEKRLASLAGEANQQGELLHLLAAVAAAKQNVPVAQLQSATFETGTLKLQLRAPDAATLEQYSQALRASGYTAAITSGTVRSGNYEGQVELRNPGS
jgi:type II secretion system protein L